MTAYNFMLCKITAVVCIKKKWQQFFLHIVLKITKSTNVLNFHKQRALKFEYVPSATHQNNVGRL